MKKIILIIPLCFSLLISAQKKYSEYQASDEVFNLSVVTDGDRKGAVYMDIKKDGKSSMELSTIDDLNRFKLFLSKSKSKFVEWSKTAIENNVDEVRKEIMTEQLGNSIAFHYGSWHFSFGKHMVSSIFWVYKSKPYLILKYPEVVESDNQYIDQKPITILFNGVDQINTLANNLSGEKIDTFIKEIENKKNLFK